MGLSMFRNMIALALFCMAGVPSALAARDGDFQTTKLNFFQTNYSGEKHTSLSAGSPGYGVEFFRDGGGSILRSYIKGRFGTSSGSMEFLDGSDELTSEYSFYFGQAELGLLVFPISRRESGTNIYLGAGGVVGYNLLSLPSTVETTTLGASHQSVSYGYSASVGVELIFAAAMKSHYMGTFEVTYRSEQAQLAGQNQFDLSGLTLSLGFGW